MIWVEMNQSQKLYNPLLENDSLVEMHKAVDVSLFLSNLKKYH